MVMLAGTLEVGEEPITTVQPELEEKAVEVLETQQFLLAVGYAEPPIQEEVGVVHQNLVEQEVQEW
jgi:hypothetical protein